MSTADTVPWLATLRNWPRAALERLEQQPSVVRVLVAQLRGSAPREAGVSMLIDATEVIGTIGGGQLEWQAIAAARALLAATEATVRVQRLVLGADLAQCCGGVVELWLERFVPDDRALLAAALAAAQTRPTWLESRFTPAGMQRSLLTAEQAAHSGELKLRRDLDGSLTLLERLDDALPAVWLYGAGYVGQALARILLDLPLQLTWIDARAHLFPSGLPPAVALAHDPIASLARVPAGAHVLIMTHSHALDYALCRALLERQDLASLGVIGSDSKSARFRSRLRREGVPAERLARLTCPIGIGGIRSKWPAAIAVAVAARLLLQLEQARATRAGMTAATTTAATTTAATATTADCHGDCENCQTGARATP
jgi:xanthine dehydrogenase accessory factor